MREGCLLDSKKSIVKLSKKRSGIAGSGCQKKDRNRKNVGENGGEAYGLFCAY